MIATRRRWVALFAALGLCGCAGGGTGQPVMMPAGNAGGAGAPSGSVVVRVRVPASIAAAAGAPNAQRVQSLGVAVAGTSIDQTIALAPGSPGCAPPSGGFAECQTSFGLGAGTYAATVSLYTSASAAPGSATSSQIVGFTVGSNAGGTVNLTLSATPASLALVPASITASTAAQNGLVLYGAGKHELAVELFDANQNVIVGALPAFDVSQGGGSPVLSIASSQSPGSAPNLFTIAVPNAPASGVISLRVAPVPGYGSTSSLCSQAATACGATVPVTLRQLIAVANDGTGSVALYGDGQTSPLAIVAAGVEDPQALIFDTSGDLFVANQPGSVTEFAPPYAQVTATIGAGVNHPQALALDARGDLFVANGNGSNSITEYAAPYAGGPSATITAGIDDPVSLGLDANANIYAVNQAANTLTIYAPPYTGAPTTVSNGLSGPNSLAIDSHGNVFVANLNSTPNSVVEYMPPFSPASAPAVNIVNGVNEQGAISLGGADTLFVPNQGENAVTEYLAPYGGAPVRITGGQMQPVALALDASANLFVANYGNNTVTEYAPPYAGSAWTTLSTGISSPQSLALSPPTSPGETVVP